MKMEGNMKFSDKINNAIISKNSVLVVGLDPNLEYYPSFVLNGTTSVKEQAEAVYAFNKLIIDCVHDKCVAVKPQLAYYEVFGSYGIETLEKTIAYAKKKKLLVINDAKRGDIGTTCEAYARAFLSNTILSGDAITVNPYLGRDGIIPFIKEANVHGKGIFVLVKTSNTSSGDLQDILTANNEPIYLEVAKLVKTLINDAGESGFSDIGVVVGATYPKEAKIIREVLNKAIFLVPGYGAQGATGRDLVEYFDQNGLGSVVASSRGITYPHLHTDLKNEIDKESFIELVIKAVEDTNADINKYRK